VTRPAVRIAWSLAARETTFALGALALFVTATRDSRPATAPTASWVPLPLMLAYAIGVPLVAFGIAMFAEKYAAAGAARAGLRWIRVKAAPSVQVRPWALLRVLI
jgi:hypothetical protein